VLNVDVVKYKKWVLQVDREATLKAYAATPAGGADTCECLYCKNFVAAREDASPMEFRALLEKLGIDYRKDAEVYELSPDGSRVRSYSGWFHFVGSIVSVDGHEVQRPTKPPQIGVDLWVPREQINDTFGITFCLKSDLSHAAFEGHDLVQVEFDTEVPWVLDEPAPDW